MTADVSLVDGYSLLYTTSAGVEPAQGGLYRRDTRFLTGLDVTVDDGSFSAIGSELIAPNHQLVRYADGFSTVNEISESGEDKRTSVILECDRHVAREGILTDEITITNHSSTPVTNGVRLDFDADFADLFEIRGVNGGIDRTIESAVDGASVTYEYGYDAADGTSVRYRTTITFDPVPDEIAVGHADFEFDLDGQDAATVTATVTTAIEDRSQSRSTTSSLPDVPVIESDVAEYAKTFEQAAADIEALSADSPHGPVLLAGAPWFATVFGRDSLLSAYQVLPVAPDLAEGVLSYLAGHQSTAHDPERRAEPGKMFHEIRHGEFARRGEIDYDPFYGTIDATALWIVLLDETVRWTGNETLVEELATPLDAAIEWVIDAMDADVDDPFVYYDATEDDPLTHTAWKDSDMSVQFADGTEATPPLASAEVQGYVYDALQRGARMLRTVRDDPDRADTLENRAATLHDRFNETFWLPERSYYAAAVTGDGQRVDAYTSNVGQCLWSGIVDPDRADAVVDRLFSEELYSGWGVRSMSTADAGYSPVSYHIGSVWPHDNSLIALGLAQYGYADRVEQLSKDVLDAASNFTDNRMPEVFCGFSDQTSPVRYPASCEPQAWGAGTPYALVRALIGVVPSESDVPPVLSDEFGLTSATLRRFEARGR
ncbi:amylo-alpha-1,6-glucosidase [Salinarchaeum laminariae]|uniref:amylo-alpha-1,6-glucosidase n=1 Tax=Salinarchaeum laminariae TaxID=869888 RepID=UPI0020C04A7C|nr:glycogen debranching N-terminal domain-containing protein [Salinarchaeum laminariae]